MNRNTSMVLVAVAAGIMIAGTLAVASSNSVHADQSKLFCGSFCVSGSNQDAKNVCQTFGEDCHNNRQLCSLENGVKCTKG